MLSSLKYFPIHLSLFFLWIPILTCSQTPKLKFKHITNEQGLSNSTIESIYQDHRGFIWFATRDGLNRYDGYKTVVYRYDPKDSSSISDNYIRYIYEDKNDGLWIGTNNGLNRFDMSKNNFTRYKHNANDPNSLSSNIVNCIYEDHNGNLWISTFGGGINLFKPVGNKFIQYRHNALRAESLDDDYVNYLYEDSQNNFWIGTESGLNLFNRQNGTFKVIRNLPLFNGSKFSNGINIIKEDKSRKFMARHRRQWIISI